MNVRDDATVRMGWLTPVGDAAIAVIRLEGAAAARLLAPHLRPPSRHPSGPAGDHGGPLEIRLLVDEAGQAIDEVLVRTVNEQAIELCCHGGLLTCQRITQVLGRSGATLGASHGPVQSTLEQEAQRELLAARSVPAARFFLSELESGTSAALRSWLAAPQLAEDEVRRELEVWRLRFHSAHALARPPRVVLVGPVNAGKSSLFNALVREARAIVSPLAGTTRDPMRAEIMADDFLIELWDTAGLAADSLAVQAAGPIDRMARDLTASLAAQADLVVQVVDLARMVVAEWRRPGRAEDLVVGTKSDCSWPREAEPLLDLTCSVRTGDGLRALRVAIRSRLGLLAPGALAAPAPFLSRHLRALDRAREAESVATLRTELRAWLGP